MRSAPTLVAKRFRQLSALSRYEWWVLLQALVGLPLVAACLRMFGFNRTQAVLITLFPLKQTAVDPLTIARSAARVVNSAARHGPYRANCLSRSLTLWTVLRRKGIQGNLRIGVARSGRDLLAHAWIEYDGLVINDSPHVAQRYAVFDHFFNGDSVAQNVTFN